MLRVPVKLIGTLASTNHCYIARNFFPTARALIALRGHMTYILFPPRETLRFSGNKMNCYLVKVTFTPKGERELVPRDQVSPWIVACCLLLLHKSKWLHTKELFWTVFIWLFSILRDSQLESDVCRWPLTWLSISLMRLFNKKSTVWCLKKWLTAVLIRFNLI